jgi:membrane protein implicated in regulation of membrane protease activity
MEVNKMVKGLFISLVVYSVIAIWYVAPWLKKLDKRQALTAQFLGVSLNHLLRLAE